MPDKFQRQIVGAEVEPILRQEYYILGRNNGRFLQYL